MEKIKFKIVLDSDYQTTAPHAEVLVNDTVIFDARVTGKSYITYTKEFDNEGNHKLIVKLKNKQPEDTEVDAQGNIVKDSLLKIDKVVIEDIEIHNNFSLNTEMFYYEHSEKKETLYNTLGINGQAVINFSTPFYAWLLETI